MREEAAVEEAMAKAAEHFGGIDILVNNASAIFLAGTLDTPMKRVDLMFNVNVRATYLCAQKALPYLLKSSNPHILNLSPPLNMTARWFAPHTAYTIAKYGMSMCVLGMAEEFREQGVAVNALWPRTVIATAAINMIDGVKPEYCRKPEIIADAAHCVLSSESRELTGQFLIDDEVLAQHGITDLDSYAVVAGNPLLPDLFLD